MPKFLFFFVLRNASNCTFYKGCNSFHFADDFGLRITGTLKGAFWESDGRKAVTVTNSYHLNVFVSMR